MDLHLGLDFKPNIFSVLRRLLDLKYIKRVEKNFNEIESRQSKFLTFKPRGKR
jgi:hypothetical protein